MYGGKLTEEFKIFPNPATDKVSIEIITNGDAEAHTLQIWNLDGKIVKTLHVIANKGSNLFSVAISDINAGNYVMQHGQNLAVFMKK